MTESIDQIAFADKVLITKSDDVDSEMLRVLEQKLEKLNPFAAIERLNLEDINVTDVLGLQLFDEQKKERVSEPEKDTGHHHHAHHDHSDGHSHDYHHDHANHTSGIVSLSLTTNDPIHPTLIDMWMNELVMTYGMDLLRYKGVLHLYGDSNQIIYQGVNMTFKAARGEPWGEKERESVLVFIGKNLPLEEMKQSFEKCILTKEVMEELNI